MLGSSEQRGKTAKFLSCFLGVFISIAALLITVSPSLAAPEAFSTGRWSGSGKATPQSSNPTGEQTFTMTLVVRSINQTDKTWSGTLFEDIYSGSVGVNGTFDESFNTFSTVTEDGGYKYEGILSNAVIRGKWSANDIAGYKGTFLLRKD